MLNGDLSFLRYFDWSEIAGEITHHSKKSFGFVRKFGQKKGV